MLDGGFSREEYDKRLLDYFEKIKSKEQEITLLEKLESKQAGITILILLLVIEISKQSYEEAYEVFL